MAPVPRLSRWAVLDGDRVILAGPTDHCATELLRIVAMDCAHFPPTRPFSLHAHADKPILLGQYCVCDREPSCESARLLEIDGESEHHPAVHIDDNTQRWSLDRLAVFSSTTMTSMGVWSIWATAKGKPASGK